MSVYQDKRGRWEVAFMQSGRRVHRVCPPGTSRARAVEYETKLRQAAFRVDKLGELPEYSLDEAISRYLREYSGKDKRGVESRIRTFADAVQGRSLGEIVGIAESLRRGNDGVTSSTINRRLAILRRVANLAYRKWGWLSEDLGSKIQLLPENSPREVYLSKEQIKALAEAQGNVQVKAAIYIAAYTGLRSGELLALQREDIRVGVIHVRTSKSGKPRMVPVIPKIRPWLRLLPIGSWE